MNNKLPKISIVMLNYNGLKYLKQTIPPILKLNCPNHDFIIVDNGSTDGSIEFIKKFKNIKIIENKENLGISEGRNIGVNASLGDYLLILDNDILIDPGLDLSNVYKSYNKLDNPAFMNFLLINLEDLNAKKTKQYGGYYGVFGIKDNRYVKLKNLKNLKDPLKTTLSHGGAMFFKRSIWNRLGGLDESQPFNLDDDDISLRATVFGYTNYAYTQDYFIHLGQERRRNNKEYAWKYKYYFSGKLKPIIKNFEFRTMIFMVPLFIIVTIIKTIKQALFRLDPSMFSSLGYSIRLFFHDLPDTLSKRKIIQENRKIRDKNLLMIKFPAQ